MDTGGRREGNYSGTGQKNGAAKVEPDALISKFNFGKEGSTTLVYMISASFADIIFAVSLFSGIGYVQDWCRSHTSSFKPREMACSEVGRLRTSFPDATSVSRASECGSRCV